MEQTQQHIDTPPHAHTLSQAAASQAQNTAHPARNIPNSRCDCLKTASKASSRHPEPYLFVHGFHCGSGALANLLGRLSVQVLHERPLLADSSLRHSSPLPPRASQKLSSLCERSSVLDTNHAHQSRISTAHVPTHVARKSKSCNASISRHIPANLANLKDQP